MAECIEARAGSAMRPPGPRSGRSPWLSRKAPDLVGREAEAREHFPSAVLARFARRAAETLPAGAAEAGGAGRG